jgi:hypothetical protein
MISLVYWVQRLHGTSSQVDWLIRSAASSSGGCGTISQVDWVRCRLGAKTAWNVLTSRLADSFRGFFFRWLRHDITSRFDSTTRLPTASLIKSESRRSHNFIGWEYCSQRSHKLTGCLLPTASLIKSESRRSHNLMGWEYCSQRSHKLTGCFLPRLLLPVGPRFHKSIGSIHHWCQVA